MREIYGYYVSRGAAKLLDSSLLLEVIPFRRGFIVGVPYDNRDERLLKRAALQMGLEDKTPYTYRITDER